MFPETRRALSKLEYAAGEIARSAGRPELYGPVDRQWYRYPDEGLLPIIAVKAARVVSGLNAAFRLLEHGFSVEAAVIFRTVDDFIDEITFLVEGHQSGAPTRAHDAFEKHFYSETVDSTEELLEDRRRPDRVKRKNIQASQARYLGADNPDYSRRMVKAVDQGFDGYVHGAYPHSMELFDPNRAGGTFRFNGTDGTPYPASARKHLAFYVSRALSLFGMVALHLNREPLKEELVAARNRFESSSEYPSDSDERGV
jgi:hypothetical protein